MVSKYGLYCISVDTLSIELYLWKCHQYNYIYGNVINLSISVGTSSIKLSSIELHVYPWKRHQLNFIYTMETSSIELYLWNVINSTISVETSSFELYLWKRHQLNFIYTMETSSIELYLRNVINSTISVEMSSFELYLWKRHQLNYICRIVISWNIYIYVKTFQSHQLNYRLNYICWNIINWTMSVETSSTELYPLKHHQLNYVCGNVIDFNSIGCRLIYTRCVVRWMWVEVVHMVQKILSFSYSSKVQIRTPSKIFSRIVGSLCDMIYLVSCKR